MKLIAAFFAIGSSAIPIAFVQAQDKKLRSRSLSTPVTATNVCDDYSGQEGYGLCVSYCITKECGTGDHPSCDAVEASWNKVTGGATLPCEVTSCICDDQPWISFGAETLCKRGCGITCESNSTAPCAVHSLTDSTSFAGGCFTACQSQYFSLGGVIIMVLEPVFLLGVMVAIPQNMIKRCIGIAAARPA